jgi:hypothetical protein
MANYSRWEDVRKKRPEPDVETRAEVEHDLALGPAHRGWPQPAGVGRAHGDDPVGDLSP